MEKFKDFKILRIFVGEEKKYDGKLVYKSIMNRLQELKVAGATVFKGIEGFGSSFRLHSSRIIEISENLPIMIEVVDKPKEIHRALKALKPILLTNCLVTMQNIQVLPYNQNKKRNYQTKIPEKKFNMLKKLFIR